MFQDICIQSLNGGPIFRIWQLNTIKFPNVHKMGLKIRPVIVRHIVRFEALALFVQLCFIDLTFKCTTKLKIPLWNIDRLDLAFPVLT
jgi:hypothetical protein